MYFRIRLIALSYVFTNRPIPVLIAQFLLVLYRITIFIVKHSEVPDAVRPRLLLSDLSVQIPHSSAVKRVSTVISELFLAILVFKKYNPGNLKYVLK